MLQARGAYHTEPRALGTGSHLNWACRGIVDQTISFKTLAVQIRAKSWQSNAPPPKSCIPALTSSAEQDNEVKSWSFSKSWGCDNTCRTLASSHTRLFVPRSSKLQKPSARMRTPWLAAVCRSTRASASDRRTGHSLLQQLPGLRTFEIWVVRSLPAPFPPLPLPPFPPCTTKRRYIQHLLQMLGLPYDLPSHLGMVAA